MRRIGMCDPGPVAKRSCLVCRAGAGDVVGHERCRMKGGQAMHPQRMGEGVLRPTEGCDGKEDR